MNLLSIINSQLADSQASLSGSVIDTVTKTGNLRTVPVECHGDDTPLIFHDTPLSSLLILLVYVSKFNFHDTPMTLPLRLALGGVVVLSCPWPIDLSSAMCLGVVKGPTFRTRKSKSRTLILYNFKLKNLRALLGCKEATRAIAHYHPQTCSPNPPLSTVIHMLKKTCLDISIHYPASYISEEFQ